MSTREEWLAANDSFLAGRTAWLRRRLEALAASASGSASGSIPDDAGPAGDPGTIPLLRLATAFKLSGFEANILFLCVAVELDPDLAALCGAAASRPELPYPTFGLARALFADPAWDALSPEEPLRYWPLVCVDEARPLPAARLYADQRIVDFALGLDHLDERLGALASHLPLVPNGLSASQHEVARRLATLATGTGQGLAVTLPGPHRDAKEMVAAEAAASLGLRLFTLDAGDIPADPVDAVRFARLWQRESVLSGVALFLDAAELDAADPQAGAVRRWLGHTGGLIFVAVHEPWPQLGALAVDVAKPTTAEQAEAWRAGLGGAGKATDGNATDGNATDGSPTDGKAAEGAGRLAATFDFDLTAITATLARAETDGQSGPDAVWSAALETSGPALDRLAQRVRATVQPDALKLPAAERSLLAQIAGQVAHRDTVYNGYGFAAGLQRGTGLSVLFAGESGTGKTMAAEALANELGLLLYKIDLSAVVSKYIGETEKNLRKLFDAAENGGAILFFDEADALFGMRSDVKDSHDRYANIEVSYLLQRIESFRGLAILATNRKDSLDQAFLRRLRFVLDFPFPALPERLAIWQAVFPAAAPVGELDFGRLSRLNLTGGSIHNVALNAAFMAAGATGTVTMDLVLAAARDEIRKLGRPVNEGDFAWHGELVDHGH
ncbi:hypothetical protein AL755_14970 [Arthrobacter sp. ERGS1:01]|uniref:ATP-binding protein n=1 Tax=Arthrobacter sp. ERGS1:01 TaxID=1704044 RepID=UPI0006B5FFC9|nr:ATP-binding protein [Arthrobacter sp. ERGS1:01]ALE06458.1 hypothetical protein AL755_14970 [Arthrobacter sp. ERGS1:01]